MEPLGEDTCPDGGAWDGMMALPEARSVAPKGTPCSPFVAACRPPEPPRDRELALPAYELPRRST